MNFIVTSPPTGKLAGQFFTPEHIAKSLVAWVVRSADDQLLDPSCGDGAILAHHAHCSGVERDPYWAWRAQERNPGALIHNQDFFEWAANTSDRFDCAAGNPPFIRYQNFKGLSKAAALSVCEANGFKLTGLSSTWPAFLVVAASLLRLGGRMAFVVPAEIGQASYAVPLIDFLLGAFAKVQVVAVRDKLFPKLSEDCWLLYCDGRGGKSDHIYFSRQETFGASSSPLASAEMGLWSDIKKNWRGRLRPLLLSTQTRDLYTTLTNAPAAIRFDDFAQIGIGYITGDNDFFHLTPTEAAKHRIPPEYLLPTVRRGQFLKGDAIDEQTLQRWKSANVACFLLHVPPTGDLPEPVARYLASERGADARTRYKCRVRQTWYKVPGVVTPDYFLQYMSGREVSLARNDAAVSCTNSVLAVNIHDSQKAALALSCWKTNFTKLSCELEGHPLGGGMLKLEPREAPRINFHRNIPPDAAAEIADGLNVMRRWRHDDQNSAKSDASLTISD